MSRHFQVTFDAHDPKALSTSRTASIWTSAPLPGWWVRSGWRR
ncbi:hypothetical protein ACBI99_36365 [Nonomuraea sp. ATR24]